MILLGLQTLFCCILSTVFDLFPPKKASDMQKKIKVKPGTEKWKKLFEMINEVTEKESLSFNDIKEIFSIGYELYKRKKGVMENGHSIISKYKSSMHTQ